MTTKANIGLRVISKPGTTMKKDVQEHYENVVQALTETIEEFPVNHNFNAYYAKVGTVAIDHRIRNAGSESELYRCTRPDIPGAEPEKRVIKRFEIDVLE